MNILTYFPYIRSPLTNILRAYCDIRSVFFIISRAFVDMYSARFTMCCQNFDHFGNFEVRGGVLSKRMPMRNILRERKEGGFHLSYKICQELVVCR